MDASKVLDAFRPHRRSVDLIADGGLEDELLRLEEQLAKAREADEREDGDAATAPQAPVIAEQILALQEQAKDSTVTFVFESIGRKKWTDLEASHPPSQKQLEVAEEQDLPRPPYNPDTFCVAAMAESLVEPSGVTEDLLAEWEKSFTAGQWNRLWNACLIANLGVGDVGESVAAYAVAKRSTTRRPHQSDSESPDPSS